MLKKTLDIVREQKTFLEESEKKWLEKERQWEEKQDKLIERHTKLLKRLSKMEKEQKETNEKVKQILVLLQKTTKPKVRSFPDLDDIPLESFFLCKKMRDRK